MQWIMKLAGMICILGACLLTGMGLERRLKKRTAILREMAETLTLLEKEMAYHKAPVVEAFQSAAGRCGTELGPAFAAAADRVSRREGKSFREIWEQAVRLHIPSGVLNAGEMELICETAGALCNTDTVLQRTLLEKYADRFRELGGLAARECEEKGILCRKLSMAAGVFLIILFL